MKLKKVKETDPANLKDGEYFQTKCEQTKMTLLTTNKGSFYTITGLRAYYAQVALYGDVANNKEKKIK